MSNPPPPKSPRTPGENGPAKPENSKPGPSQGAGAGSGGSGWNGGTPSSTPGAGPDGAPGGPGQGSNQRRSAAAMLSGAFAAAHAQGAGGDSGGERGDKGAGDNKAGKGGNKKGKGGKDGKQRGSKSSDEQTSKDSKRSGRLGRKGADEDPKSKLDEARQLSRELATASSSASGVKDQTTKISDAVRSSDTTVTKKERATAAAKAATNPSSAVGDIGAIAVKKTKQRIKIFGTLMLAFGLFIVLSNMNDSNGGRGGWQPTPSAAAVNTGDAEDPIPTEMFNVYYNAGAATGVPWTLLAGIAKVATDHGRMDPTNPDWTEGQTYGSEGGPQGIFMINPKGIEAENTDIEVNLNDNQAAALWLSNKMVQLRHQVINEGLPDGVDPNTPEGVDALWAAVLAKLPLAYPGTSSTSYAMVTRVLLVGDSLAVGAELGGAVDKIAAGGLPIPVVDAAVGRRTDEMIALLPAYSLSASDLLIVSLGANDGPDGVAERVDSFMMAVNGARVLWLNLDLEDWGEGNAAMVEAEGRWPNLTVLDWAAESIANPTWRASDGIHYTGDGYAAMADFIASAAGQTGQLGITPLLGPDCDGVKGTGQTYMGKVNGTLSTSDLQSSPWGPLQPAAAASWQAMVDAAVADGFSPDDFKGGSGGPGSRNGGYSNHTIGVAIDMDALAWKPTRTVAGEPITAVAWAFGLSPAEIDAGIAIPEASQHQADIYSWMRSNAWKFGWCNPRSLRPVYLNGTATGGRDAAGNGSYLEPWHFECAGCTTYHNPPKAGDLNGPFGVPDDGAGGEVLPVDDYATPPSYAPNTAASFGEIIDWALYYGGLTPEDDRDHTKPSATKVTFGTWNGTQEEVVEIIKAVFPDDIEDAAVEIARAESGLNPTINNAGVNRNGSIDYGLFQFNDGNDSDRARFCDGVVFASCGGTLQQTYFRARDRDTPEEKEGHYLTIDNTPLVNSMDELIELAYNPWWNAAAAAELWQANGGGQNGWRPWCSASHVLGIETVCG